MPSPARQEQLTGLPTREHELTQLGKGVATFQTTQACGRDVLLVGLRLEPLCAMHVVVDPEWYVLAAPVRWRGDFIFNGQQVQPGNLYIADQTEGWTTLGRERDTLCIGFRRERLRDACEALSGRPLATGGLPENKLSFATAQGDYLVKSIMAVLPALTTRNWRIALPPQVEADLLTTCALLLVEQDAWTEFRDPGRIASHAIVNRAKMALDDRYPQPLSLAELCDAAGVGKSKLHDCFVETHGVSPMAYMRARRLNAAREWLLDPFDPPRSVKDVALALGFVNGGRFAADYRSLFGETPSETFSRVKTL